MTGILSGGIAQLKAQSARLLELKNVPGIRCI